MSSKSDLYRLIDPSTNSYISEVYGFVRYEDTISPNSAYVYDKQDALIIRNRLIKLYKKLESNSTNTLPFNSHKAPQLVPVTIKDVFLSDNDIQQAILSASALEIPIQQAINNARWQKVRLYKTYLHSYERLF